MTLQELQHACAARGIRTTGSSPGRLRDELAQWIDLNLNHRVPTTLMILSRAFTFTDRALTTEDALRATFNSLPDNLVCCLQDGKKRVYIDSFFIITLGQ